MSYRGRLLMAVQAETGESASESGIRQVEVEPTAPISEVRLITLFLVGLGDLVSLDLSPKGLGKISLTKYLWENISEKISLRPWENIFSGRTSQPVNNIYVADVCCRLLLGKKNNFNCLFVFTKLR